MQTHTDSDNKDSDNEKHCSATSQYNKIKWFFRNHSSYIILKFEVSCEQMSFLYNKLFSKCHKNQWSPIVTIWVANNHWITLRVFLTFFYKTILNFWKLQAFQIAADFTIDVVDYTVMKFTLYNFFMLLTYTHVLYCAFHLYQHYWQKETT